MQLLLCFFRYYISVSRPAPRRFFWLRARRVPQNRRIYVHAVVGACVCTRVRLYARIYGYVCLVVHISIFESICQNLFLFTSFRFAAPTNGNQEKVICERSLRVPGVLRVGNGMHGKQSARQKMDCFLFVASRASGGCRPPAHPLLVRPYPK